MTNNSLHIAEADAARLSLACLAHLEQEEALLSATLTSLHQVRAALVNNNLQDLKTALAQQAHIAQAGEEFAQSATCSGRNWRLSWALLPNRLP